VSGSKIGPVTIPDTAHPRVLCLGLSALDRIWRVEAPFSGGSEKIRAGEHLTEPGGMAANAAVAVARLGGRASFWGRGGNDDAGRAMSEAFSAEGVDVGCFRLIRPANGRSSISAVRFRRIPRGCRWQSLMLIACSPTPAGRTAP